MCIHSTVRYNIFTVDSEDKQQYIGSYNTEHYVLMQFSLHITSLFIQFLKTFNILVRSV